MSWYRGLIVFLYLVNISLLYSSDDVDLRFEQISRANGLSQSTVNCFLMDRNGFMWIGTCAGLNRYDGYNFKIYKPEAGNANSLSHVYVQSIYEDPSDTCHVLWIGTQGGGLNRLDLETESFTHYNYDPRDPNTLASDVIYEICPDDDGYLWISTWGGGISKFDPKSDTFKNYHHDPLNSNTISSNDANPIIEIIKAIYGLEPKEAASMVLTRKQKNGPVFDMIPPIPKVLVAIIFGLFMKTRINIYGLEQNLVLTDLILTYFMI